MTIESRKDRHSNQLLAALRQNVSAYALDIKVVGARSPAPDKDSRFEERLVVMRVRRPVPDSLQKSLLEVFRRDDLNCHLSEGLFLLRLQTRLVAFPKRFHVDRCQGGGVYLLKWHDKY